MRRLILSVLPDKQQETDSQLLLEILVVVSILWTAQPPKKVVYSEYKWEKKRLINLSVFSEGKEYQPFPECTEIITAETSMIFQVRKTCPLRSCFSNLRLTKVIIWLCPIKPTSNNLYLLCALSLMPNMWNCILWSFTFSKEAVNNEVTSLSLTSSSLTSSSIK